MQNIARKTYKLQKISLVHENDVKMLKIDFCPRMYTIVATGPVGPVSTGPLFGALSHVFVVNQQLMAARTSFKASLPNLPDTPHHLKDVAFPKRTLKSPLGRGDFIYALLVPALCVRARVANVLGETPLRNRSMR